MHWVLRFWVLMTSIAVGVGSLCYLSLSFVFPEVPLFAVGIAPRLGITMLGVTAFSIVVGSGISEDGLLGPNEPPRGA